MEIVSGGRKLAVVTGASSGIGFELARQFAAHNYDLIIASNSDRIQDAKNALSNYRVKVETVQVDLATYNGNEELCKCVERSEQSLGAVAINAGVGVSGDFARETDLAEEIQLLRLNIESPVHLTKRLARKMIASAGGGRILYTSSVVSTMPGPFLAVYAASKAFVTSFAQAVRNELKESGVTVTVLMPGATDTDFFRRAGMMDTKVGTAEKDDPAEVAKEGFEAMMKGEDHVVAGSAKNKFQAVAGHLLPDTVLAEIHRKQAEPGTAQR